MAIGSYAGKNGLVTGAAGGMGQAMAIAFAAAGARVLIADVNGSGGEATAEQISSAGGEAFFLKTDVSKACDVISMVETAAQKFGRLDFAVNNAAIEVPTGPLADCPDEVFDRLIDVNLKGVFLCMKHEIRQMLKQDGGSIVNIASVNSFRPQPGQAAYTASKHGVLGLTRNAAIEYASAGIRINAICPGAIDTPMLESALQRLDMQNIPRDLIMNQMSLQGRKGQPEEVAKAALWLCSEEASFTFGHALAVDGGYLAR